MVVMDKQQEIDLYEDFIPFVVKTWLKNHNYSLQDADFEDCVSELYLLSKQPRFKDYSLDEKDKPMMFVMLYVMIPKVFKELFPETIYEQHDYHNKTYQDKNYYHLPVNEFHIDIAEMIWVEGKSVKNLAALYNVSESTIYNWLDIVRRAVKKSKLE
jgi:hypothetical protein